MTDKELIKEIESYCIQAAELDCWECCTADIVLKIIDRNNEKGEKDAT
tara:strand:+ start:249 stop:392 length:144 start_codon:yes stop_codon:yes gene_type:complete